MTVQYSYVILGLSITSSWGNGHATTYRALVRELAARGHDVLFLERDLPFYRTNRDLPEPPYGSTALYSNLEELIDRHARAIREADLVILGSYVPEGVEVGWLVTSLARGKTAFYDIDTPVTLRKLESGDTEYLSRELIPRFDLYLSFTGGPTLAALERRYGARRARPLHCSVDPALYFAESSSVPRRWDLGYLGTYSADRQPALEELLLEPARGRPEWSFVVAGPQYPGDIRWPRNVERVDHLAPHAHRAFYNDQRFTLNVTRQDMVIAGYSPSVRLFEAAACAVPIITDVWDGIDTYFAPGREILLARSRADVEVYLQSIGDEERAAIGAAARKRVLAEHTGAHRAEALESYTRELVENAGSGGVWPSMATARRA